MVRKCSEPTPFAACSADDDDGSGDYNGVSGGGVVVSKKNGAFLGGMTAYYNFVRILTQLPSPN